MFRFTFPSENIKTGPIAVTTSGKETCPPSCPLYKRGCYASYGPLRIWWEKTNITFRQMLRKIERLPHGSLWRHNQAGDLAGKGEKIDSKKLEELVEANRGKRGFCYTHKNPRGNEEKI